MRKEPGLPGLIELENPDGLPRDLPELKIWMQSLKPNRDGRPDRTIRALIWPFKQGEVKKNIDYLGEFQKLLSVTLNVDNTCVALIYPQTSS